MPIVRQSIEVDAPIEDCYEAWSNFDNFPRFMSGVESVRKVGNESHWVANVLGVRQEWRATTTQADRPRLIAWESAGDVGMNGRVNFTQLEPRRTKVEVEMDWRGGVLQEVAGAVGLGDAAVLRDLGNFKQFVEGRKTARPAPR